MVNPFLSACRGEPAPHTPIWLNRQAGRYMADYHRVKGELTSLQFFKHSERAAQATLDAQRILGVDAAIVFADLLPMLEPMGLELDYVPGEGPVFANPVPTAADVAALASAPAAQATPYIGETVARVREGLPKGVGLIGFAGAPFTLASYAVEGRGSRNYIRVKKMMYEAPQLWAELLHKLTDQLISYLELQIERGVDAVQLFDSWVGCLSLADFRRYVVPETRRLVAALTGRVPVIYFGTGNGHLLGESAALGADVLALDWRTPLADTWAATGCRAVQGNLDPIVLCADRPTIAREAQRILDEVAGRPGHIFNLGHGIVPETPVDNVKFLVDYVHEHGTRSPNG
jgi:uroporphyrinogen decarboxylase